MSPSFRGVQLDNGRDAERPRPEHDREKSRLPNKHDKVGITKTANNVMFLRFL